jgi:aspartate aminotransferase
MPELSQRAHAMPSSPIRKLAPYATAARAQGKTVIPLNIGQPDVLTPPAFWQAIREVAMPTLEYSHSAGTAVLCAAATAEYRRQGILIEERDLLVTVGGSEATLFAFLACFNPGDEVIVVEPFYANYLGFATEADVTIVPITSTIETDFALPSVADFEAKLTNRTKGILLCNPSNPTGGVYSPESLLAIAALAKSRDLFLIVDEVYRDFYYGQESLLSVLQIEGLEQNAIMIDSVSKKLSLCGARVGFIVSRNHAVMDAALRFGQARLCAPTLDQTAVARAIQETPPSYYAEVRAEYMARRDLLVALLKEVPGVLCPRIDGAFYAVVRLPVDDADAFAQWLLTDFDLDGDTVMLAPASGFYATPGLGKDEVRIAYVLERPRLQRAVECLAAALAVYPGRTVKELAFA